MLRFFDVQDQLQVMTSSSFWITLKPLSCMSCCARLLSVVQDEIQRMGPSVEALTNDGVMEGILAQVIVCDSQVIRRHISDSQASETELSVTKAVKASCLQTCQVCKTHNSQLSSPNGSLYND